MEKRYLYGVKDDYMYEVIPDSLYLDKERNLIYFVTIDDRLNENEGDYPYGETEEIEFVGDTEISSSVVTITGTMSVKDFKEKAKEI